MSNGIIIFYMKNNTEKIRHSLSHLLAIAVLEKFPGTKLGIGPAIENGFYYDFGLPKGKTFSDADLAALEEKMKDYVKSDLRFKKEIVTSAAARKLFSGQPYKMELIDELKKQKKPISIYRTLGATSKSSKPLPAGKQVKAKNYFTDLCAGPHISSTKEINPAAFKLNKIAGAYWRGDEKNKMLTRIYGWAFETGEELKNHLNFLDEVEKRDHRKLGKELDLFVFSDLVGPGLPLYTPRGATVRREVIGYSNELQQEIGYQEVHTPNMNKADLFKTSGHYEKYKEDMFRVVSNYTKEEYFLKPMNCPQHTQIFASKKRSYKDLPVRIADFANLYRDERPGELSGLIRLRAFGQDDGHCFCRDDQIEEELLSVFQAIKKAMQTYQMEYSIRLSLRDNKHPEKYLGDAKVWNKAEKLLENFLVKHKIQFFKAKGEAAIYGPKMDLMIKDSIGREWQISTIQVDFIMPQRFGLTYTDQSGKERPVVMIHRAIVGSPDRFIGVLIEHFAGAFPTWLAPVQVAVLPVSEKQLDYAERIEKTLKEKRIRTELKSVDETLGKRIRESEMQKIPYSIIVGEQEKINNSVSIRKRGQSSLAKVTDGEKGEMMLDKFIDKILKEISERAS